MDGVVFRSCVVWIGDKKCPSSSTLAHFVRIVLSHSDNRVYLASYDFQNFTSFGGETSDNSFVI